MANKINKITPETKKDKRLSLCIPKCRPSLPQTPPNHPRPSPIPYMATKWANNKRKQMKTFIGIAVSCLDWPKLRKHQIIKYITI
jgi:hypothetical protein